LQFIRHRLSSAFESTGEFGFFGLQAIRLSVRPPFEFAETAKQLFEIGWNSTPLIIVAGFAVGAVLALQTQASMTQFGATALVPEAVSFGLFKDVGPLVAGLLISGRAGAGIGAELAGMRVTQQIDALEALAVNSFKYLVITRIVACVIALPVLTTVLDFSGLVGGWVVESLAQHMSIRQFLNDAFDPMDWSDYIPPILKTFVFGLIIGLVSCFVGYNASGGATGVGRASTRGVVVSSILIILSDVILVKAIQFWYA
jgi:phospholipid/cholesterol/gamma-HCH transport system permease protein